MTLCPSLLIPMLFFCLSLVGQNQNIGPDADASRELSRSLEAQVISEQPLKINFFCANRSGLAKDRTILGEALRSLGCLLELYDVDNRSHVLPADINIFCETLCPEYFKNARVNWFIPNPEWDWNGGIKEYLNSIDLILCRTHEVERIFSKLGVKTFFLGFSSPDHYEAKISKDYASFLHLPGTSWQKGTRSILKAWNQNPDFPHLTLVKSNSIGSSLPPNIIWMNQWLSEEHLHALQNTCGVHLCLSETEGFGHYLMEAMSVGAVILTTDAPPMNEFVEDPRCLVPYTSWRFQKLATNYYVDPKDVEDKVSKLLKLSLSDLKSISKHNRKRYLKLRKEFKENLKQLLLTKLPL